MKKRFILFLVLCIAISCGAQFVSSSYVEGIALLGASPQFGNGISFYDINKDGLDDLTVGDAFHPIKIYYNTGDTLMMACEIWNEADVKSINWVDYDRDGDPDLFISASNSYCRLLRNEGNLVFTDVSASLNLPATPQSYFGSTWCDFNKDSWPDVFVCIYGFSGSAGLGSFLLANNGDGTFADVSLAMGINPLSKASFQAVWTDFNLDGWQDLYVANDKENGNELYLNMQGAGFMNASVLWNANVQLDSMCSTTADFDNDGDEDIYLTNHQAGNFLLENNDSLFYNSAADHSAGCYSFCWGSLWLDIDHDTWQDLYVATSADYIEDGQNFLLKQNSDNMYEEFNIVGDNLLSTCTAKGDLNNDGYWDIATHNLMPSTFTCWESDTNYWRAMNLENHWLKVALNGTISDKDAIGTLLEFFINERRYVRQTICGESFIAQNSQYEILSLGEFNTMDSLIIHWPLGWVDKYYNLGGDQFYSFTEGETYLCEITSSAGNQLCTAGGSLTLSAGEHLSYLWSDASTSLSLDVNAAGIYEVTVTNEYGLQATATFEVVYYDELEVEISTQQPLCAASSDGTISIIADDEQVTNILWSNEQSGLQLQNLSQGEYTYQLTDMNGCEYENTIILADPAPVVASVTAENILCNGGTTVLSAAASGGTGAYTLQWSLSDPTQAPAGEHSLTVTDANGCSALHIITLDEPSLIVIDNNTQAVCNGEYTAADVSTTGGTGALQQNWNGVDETHLFAGDYSLTVTDANGCATTSVITIVEYAALAVTTTITDANEGNNGSILLGVTGGVEPYTFYWSNGATGNPLEGIGQGFYTCTITDGAGCVFYSENCQLTDMNVEEWHAMTHVFPNPFTNQLIVETIGTDEVMIYDATGRLMLQKVINKREQMDTTAWPSGVYFIHLGNALYSGMCVKE